MGRGANADAGVPVGGGEWGDSHHHRQPGQREYRRYHALFRRRVLVVELKTPLLTIPFLFCARNVAASGASATITNPPPQPNGPLQGHPLSETCGFRGETMGILSGG